MLFRSRWLQETFSYLTVLKKKKKEYKEFKAAKYKNKTEEKILKLPARKSQYVNMYTQIPVDSQLLSHPK